MEQSALNPDHNVEAYEAWDAGHNLALIAAVQRVERPNSRGVPDETLPNTPSGLLYSAAAGSLAIIDTYLTACPSLL